MIKSTKTRLIVGIALMVLGLVILVCAAVAAGGDFNNFSTVEYKTETYEITDPFTAIAIDTTTADITILPSENGKCTVTCCDEKNLYHTVAVKNGTLTVNKVDERQWYEHIGISCGSSSVTVYLPTAEYGKLSVNATTGDVIIESVTLDTLDLDLTTGYVTVTGAQISGDITVNVSTGDILLADTNCKNLTFTGSTGDVTLKNAVASENLSIDRSTGDIRFHKSDAGEITVSTGTGDVTGTLSSAKVFSAETRTGSVSVPKSTAGGICEITTSTGDIKIEIE